MILGRTRAVANHSSAILLSICFVLVDIVDERGVVRIVWHVCIAEFANFDIVLVCKFRILLFELFRDASNMIDVCVVISKQCDARISFCIYMIHV